MNPTTNPISKKQQHQDHIQKKNPMQVTLEETHVTLLSSIKGKVKAESIEEDSIEPRLKGL